MLFFRRSKPSASTISSRRRKASRNSGRQPHNKNSRRLVFDPLEARNLLTVVPLNANVAALNTDMQVTDTSIGTPLTDTAKSVATDNNGDFVVTWTSYDGNGVGNVYAKYYTNQVEQLKLPKSMIANGQAGWFTLNLTAPSSAVGLSSETIQQINVDPGMLSTNASTASAAAWHTASLIQSAVNVSETVAIAPISFNQPPNAAPYPNPPGTVGASATPWDVEVLPTTGPNSNYLYFNVSFVGDSGDQDLTHTVNGVQYGALSVSAIYSTNNGVNTAIPVNADVTTLEKVSSPAFEVNAPQIQDPLSSTSTEYTQNNPQVAMDADGDFVIVWQAAQAPSTELGADTSDIYAREYSTLGYVADQSFETLSFTGVTGQMSGNYTLDVGGQATGAITFNEPTTPALQSSMAASLYTSLQALDPSVSMGVEYAGEVTSGSQVTYKFSLLSSPANPFPEATAAPTEPNLTGVTITDSYGVSSSLPAADQSAVQGVRPLGNQYRVNSFTANAQVTPSVAMDENGNFTVAWANVGVDNSYFNGITAQRFDRDSARVGGEFQVNTEDTSTHLDPYVAVSSDGEYMAIVWETTTAGETVLGKVYQDYDTNGNLLADSSGNPIPVTAGAFATLLGKADNGEFLVAPGSVVGGAAITAEPTAAFDANHDLLVSWDQLGTDNDLGANAAYNKGIASSDVMAEQYAVTASNNGYYGVVTPGQIIRKTFRADSSNYVPNGAANINKMFPLYQSGSQAASDANGDLTVLYSGYGPEVAPATLPALATGLASGEANGVMMTQFDANPTETSGVDSSDDVVNATRDGTNAVFNVEIDSRITGGTATAPSTFTLGVQSLDAQDPDGPVDVLVQGATNPSTVAANIATSLRGLSPLNSAAVNAAEQRMVGINWPLADGAQYSSIQVAYTGQTNGEQETLSFTGASGAMSGWFTLTAGGATTTSILFQEPIAGNNQMAADMQAALQALYPAIPVTVSLASTAPAGTNVVYNYTIASGAANPYPTVTKSATEPALVGVTITNTAPVTIADNDFTVEFQGELHDVNMSLTEVANNLALPYVAEQQYLNFYDDNYATGSPPLLYNPNPPYNTVPENIEQGWFALKLTDPLGTSVTTDDIQFIDSTTDPNFTQLATNIQNAIRNLGGIYANVAVVEQAGVGLGATGAGSGAPNGALRVEFLITGPNDGTNMTITQEPPANHPNGGAPFTDPLYPEQYPGSIVPVQPPKVSGARPIAKPPVVTLDQAGWRGLTQDDASIAMAPDGSFVTAWTQYNGDIVNQLASPTGVYYRRFEETDDTIGPIVTDFLAPDGTRLENNAYVPATALNTNSSSTGGAGLNYMVVTFDQEMISDPTNPGAVTYNVNGAYANWALLKNGVNYSAGISHIDFGMNMAYQDGLSAVGDNKWEAVVFFNDSAIGGTGNLGNGNYELEALSSLRMPNGNPLGRTAFATNGANFTRSFVISLPTGSENRVNGNSSGGSSPNSYDPTPVGNTSPAGTQPADPSDPQSPNQVAMYGVSSTITVWTTNAFQGVVGQNAVMARIQSAGIDKEVVVSNNPNWTYTYPSVACDGDGDFVVTWSAEPPANAAQSGPGYNGWDIYARRFNADGTYAPGLTGDVFRVNSYTLSTQKYSTVAMDTEGDFTIVWQSLGEDGSGYGIYAQQYNAAGTMLGGTNETQQMTFSNNPTGTMELLWTGAGVETPVQVAVSGSGAALANTVLAALEQLDPSGPNGPSVQVTVLSQTTTTTTLQVTFVGLTGDTLEPQIVVENPQFTNPSSTVQVSTTALGAPGEFRVNDFTTNDQTFPSIAMDDTGESVISWTSAGEDNDSPTQTNIYAKTYAPISSVSGTVTAASGTSSSSGATATAAAAAAATPQIMTVNLPASHVVTGLGQYSGIGLVTVTTTAGGTAYGTGTLLVDGGGAYVLIAANLVCNINGNPDVQTATVTFPAQSGGQPIVMTEKQVFVLPGYTGNAETGGHDLALLELTKAAPTGVQRYNIYDGSGEIGQTFTAVSYGQSGVGNVPATTNLTFQNELTGENTWETTAAIAGFYGDELAYDFYDTPNHDYFALAYGITDPSTGAANEVGANDGPCLVNGLIAGVGSYTWHATGTWNVAAGVNGTFGYAFADTRVSLYASWINNTTTGGSEILVNQTTAGVRKWSSVAMDAEGDFVVTWTSYGQDGDGNGPGAGANGQNAVYARTFNSAGTPQSNEFLVNTYTGGPAEWSRVAMDAAGDYTITWQSYEDLPLPPYVNPVTGQPIPPGVPDSWGIFAQNYDRTSEIDTPYVGPDGQVGTQYEVNATTAGNQQFPSIAMDNNGDAAVVWSGYGDQPSQDDTQGIFMQRYNQATVTAGPIVTHLLDTTDGTTLPIPQIPENSVLKENPTQFWIEFDEPVSTLGGIDGLTSVTNVANWNLTDKSNSTADVSITSVTAVPAADEPVAGKIAYVITFSYSDSTTPATNALPAGNYVLTLSSNVTDTGNPAGSYNLPIQLDGNYNGLPGSNFVRDFSVEAGASTNTNQAAATVNTTGTGNCVQPVIATEPTILASGQPTNASTVSYVVVWTIQGSNGDTGTQGNIMAQMFNRAGAKVGNEIAVNTTTTGDQSAPDVAMDSSGDFIVVWSGNGPGDSSGIFARAFNSSGTALDATDVRISTFIDALQTNPTVAIDYNGDEAVFAWSSVDLGGTPADTGVFARQFKFKQPGQLGLTTLAAATNNSAFEVGPNSTYRESYPDVAMDNNGDYVITWQWEDIDGYSWGIAAQSYNSSNQALSGIIPVNTYGSNIQIYPKVAMQESTGSFVITWTSSMQDGSGYGVYAREFQLGGTPITAAFQVNTTTAGWQMNSDVTMYDNGTFDIVWQSQGQDNPPTTDYGIYLRTYAAGGAATSGEILVNDPSLGDSVSGDQTNPSITVNQDGYSVAWVEGNHTNAYTPIVAAFPEAGVAAAAASNALANDVLSENIVEQAGAPPGGGQFSQLVFDIGTTTPGLYDPNTDLFYLRSSNNTGVANYTFGYGDPSQKWIALMGDWDGSGTDSVGFYDPTTATWYLRNSNTTGVANITFGFGAPNSGWIPVVGDWTGDGVDTPGLYNPTTSTWYLRDSNSSGAASITFGFGAPGAGWTPIVGNWTGNGTDTVGFYDPKTSVFYLRNSNTTGAATTTFGFGAPGAGWTPIVGDWNQTGIDKVGFYDPKTSLFYLNTTNTTGVANLTFGYGAAGAGWLPLVGIWPAGLAENAAGGAAALPDLSSPLTNAELQPIVQEAIAEWAAAGAPQQALTAMSQAQFVISNQQSGRLGTTYGNEIELDPNADGYGWFVDPSSTGSAEFAPAGNHLQADTPQAETHMDLLTVVAHELGHIAGLPDVDSSVDDLMSATLATGERRLPTTADVDAVLADGLWN
jgi:hypothetical protein